MTEEEKKAHDQEQLNERMLHSAHFVWRWMMQRQTDNLPVKTSTEIYRLALVVRATTRDIEWDDVPNVFPKDPYFVDLSAFVELANSLCVHAEHRWFQVTPTNLLLADALEYLKIELERYKHGGEPFAYSGRHKSANIHTLERETQERMRTRKK